MQKEKWQTGFKLVRKCRDELQSWNASSICYDQCLYYSHHFITKPMANCGPLALFKTLTAARNFASLHWNYTTTYKWLIYKCRYVKSGEKYLYTTTKELKILPTGTILAKKVKLIGKKYCALPR